MRTEALVDDHRWLRVADRAWLDPLDPSFAARRGGRWTSPGGHPTLYLNEDVGTARANVRRLAKGYSIAPEDFDDERGPVLVTALLPDHQRVVDAHTHAGLAALGLPPSYPIDDHGAEVPHDVCRPIGAAAAAAGHAGVHGRSAAVPDGTGRELAWFPRDGARAVASGPARAFGDWYY